MLEIALLLVGANVAIRLEDARNVSETEQKAIVSALESAVEARSGRGTILEETFPRPCAPPERCPAQPRTEESDIVILRLFGVPTRIRLVAERIEAGRSPPGRSVEADLPRAGESWAPALERIAQDLFPQASLPKRSQAAPPGAVPPSEARVRGAIDEPLRASGDSIEGSTLAEWVPWALVGSGVVAGSIGIGLGLSARAARSAAQDEPHTPTEIDALEDRALGHGLAANVLFGTAIAGIAIGVTWLFIEQEGI